MSEPTLDWFDSLRSQCAYIEAIPDDCIVPDSYPDDLRVFLQRFGSMDIDGLQIGGYASLRPDGEWAETLQQQGLLPFARERFGSDYFCLTTTRQVVRWFHDGQRTGKILAPDFWRFLLHRSLLLCDRPEAFGEDEAAVLRADSWAELLRQHLRNAGADLTDPWWPLWC